MLKQICSNTEKIISKTFLNYFFKVLYEMSNEQLLSQSSILMFFYQDNFNENFSFKQRVRVAAFCQFIGDSFANQLLLKTQLQEQWLVNVSWSILYKTFQRRIQNSESKMDFLWKQLTALSIFAKELHFRCLTRV